MNTITFISGPCGCGKSTLADAYAKRLVDSGVCRQVYVIHGDDFHAGFVQTQERVGPDCPQFMYWPDILAFNWRCILDAADRALGRQVDVVIDYVIEEELPRVMALARRHGAQVRYVVLTASDATLRERLTSRGDPDLIDRSLFLKKKLEGMRCNQGHLLDNSAMTLDEEIDVLLRRDFTVPGSLPVPQDETQAERIARMEQILNEAKAAVRALENAIECCEAMQADVRTLEAYYTGPLWRRDYEDDEAGRLPKDLSRGVLSEDGIWNLLSDWQRLQAAHSFDPEET